MHQFLSVYYFTFLLLHVSAGRHIMYTQPHTIRNFIKQNPKLACNSEGTDELPEDGTQLPKHVGAAK
jgi:hypothetical protein